MGDQMIDLMAGDLRLRRRLEAYADARLSPDLDASSRMRARVLAVAHRRADLARADAALTVLPGSRSGRWVASPPMRTTQDRVAHRPTRRWAAVMVLAASLAVGIMTGTALAASPGGALYDARLWVEAITLPGDPSARAVAELRRLDTRMKEAREAVQAADPVAAAAALAAYGLIVDSASAAAAASGDPVAAAVLETGVGQNIVVLQEIVTRVPPQAGAAIDRAIDRAILRAVQRSGAAMEAIDPTNARPDTNGVGGNGGPGGNDGADPIDPTPGPKPTKPPTPTVRPTKPPSDPAVGPAPKPPPKAGPGGTAKPDPTPRRTTRPEH